ncbi:MAG: AraC family transcriptional regulator [Planctomycetota bacterium]|nr:AraC family transcriptional regulator [Planctomycetota bacterium]
MPNRKARGATKIETYGAGGARVLTPEGIALTPQADLARIRFRFASVAGLAIYPPGATFGPRTLRDFEFVWIVDGNVEWEADGVTYPAPPGTLILCRPGMRDMFRWDPERQTRHAYFHFTLEDDGGLPPQSTWPACRTMPEGDILRPLFRHVSWLMNAGRPDWAPLLQHAARQVLVGFLTGAYLTHSEGGLELGPSVTKALKLMQDWADGARPGAPVLGELARAANVSEGHLCRLFKKEVGVGPMQAARLIRIDRAATLLARTNLRIKEIAAQLGFENPFHFTRCFGEAWGLSPRAYRRQAQAGQIVPMTRVIRAIHTAVPRWE